MKIHKLRQKEETTFQIQMKPKKGSETNFWIDCFEGMNQLDFNLQKPCMDKLELLRSNKANARSNFRVIRIKKITTVDVIS